MTMNDIEYKFNEDKWLSVVRNYIDKTYTNHHYSKNDIQATEFINDSGHLIGFTIGNIMKYAQRYGSKGDASEHQKDILKIIHYAILLLEADRQIKEDSRLDELKDSLDDDKASHHGVNINVYDINGSFY